MSKELLGLFLEPVRSDKELQTQIENELDSDGNISIDVLIGLGIEFGYEFNVEDLWPSPDWRDEILDGDRPIDDYKDANIEINVAKRWKDVNLRFAKDRIGSLNTQFSD